MKTLFTGYTKLHRNLFFYSALLLTLLVSVWARAEQVTLAWNPNQESDLAGYKIHYGTASGSYSVHMDVQRVTTYTLTGLTAGQTYYFATTAYDTSGNESSYSNEVSYYVPKDTDGDGIPDDLEINHFGTNPNLADTDERRDPGRPGAGILGSEAGTEISTETG